MCINVVIGSSTTLRNCRMHNQIEYFVPIKEPKRVSHKLLFFCSFWRLFHFSQISNVPLVFVCMCTLLLLSVTPNVLNVMLTLYLAYHLTFPFGFRIESESNRIRWWCFVCGMCVVTLAVRTYASCYHLSFHKKY